MDEAYSIRHYVPDTDLPRLAHLLTEIETVDCDGEDTSEESLRRSLEWPNYRPDQDAWVVETDGGLIGYGFTLLRPSRHCTIYIIVHPSQRRKGIGGQLLELVLNRARAAGGKDILVYANKHNIGSNEFLKRRGFQKVGSSGTMSAPATAAVPHFELPAGFVLKNYSEVNQGRVLLQALNDCYQGMWGHQHNDDPTEEELRSPTFLNYYNADDILLMFDEKDALLGICSVKSGGKNDGHGNVSDVLDAPGIIRTHRSQGFQRQLVLAGIRHLRVTGARPVVLEFWGEDEKALNIYRELGFEMVNHYSAYQRELK